MKWEQFLINTTCFLLQPKRLTSKISETVIHNLHSRKLQGVTVHNKLKFEKHINTICPKANRKFNALARMTPYMNLQKGEY